MSQPSADLAAPSARERTWWFDARGLADNSPIWSTVEDSGCSAVLIAPEQLGRSLRKARVVWLDRPEQVEHLGTSDAALSGSEDVARAAQRSGRRAGCFVEVADLEGQFPRCLELVERGYDFLVLDMHHATYIPFEQLVVRAKAYQRNGCRAPQLLRRIPIQGLRQTVSDLYQAMNAFATLEFGVDVLLGVHDVKAITGLDRRIRLCQHGRIDLAEAEVVEIGHTLMGDRVCIDTTSLMTSKEGMIIGATGWGGVFICSETHYLPHMNLREFRVNAGAVQCYVWGPDDRAVYLSELKAGSEVLAVDTEGNTRALTVGRVKIERRPLLLIVARATLPESQRPVTIKTFVQNDWHVRIMGRDAEGQLGPRNSSLIKVGDRILVHPDWPGRHMGEKVPESIVEQ